MAFFQGFLAQGVGGPNGFVENTASGYARQAVTMAALGNGNTSLAAAVIYPAATAATTITQRALYDASTAGNLIMWWNVDTPATVAVGASDLLKVGSMSHTFPALLSGIGNGAQAVDFVNGSKIGTTAAGSAIYAGHFIEVVNGTVASKSTV